LRALGSRGLLVRAGSGSLVCGRHGGIDWGHEPLWGHQLAGRSRVSAMTSVGLCSSGLLWARFLRFPRAQRLALITMRAQHLQGYGATHLAGFQWARLLHVSRWAGCDGMRVR